MMSASTDEEWERRLSNRKGRPKESPLEEKQAPENCPTFAEQKRQRNITQIFDAVASSADVPLTEEFVIITLKQKHIPILTVF